MSLLYAIAGSVAPVDLAVTVATDPDHGDDRNAMMQQVQRTLWPIEAALRDIVAELAE